MHSTNLPINGNFLKEKAKIFADKINIDVDFKASNGWFEKFKGRHGLSFKKLCRESSSVDLESVIGGRKNHLKHIEDKFEPKDIFNADKTGLYYKLYLDKGTVMKDDTGHGVKRAKDRITVLLAAKMTGTEKLPFLIVGKSSNPRCFKGIKSLLTTYKNNKNAWMTSEIFEEWLRGLDRKMTENKRNVLLLIDNCKAHPIVNKLKSVQVEFFPPNVLLEGGLQPTYIVDILGAMYLANAAWEEVTNETIANYFRHAGFQTKKEFEENHDIALNSEVRPTISADSFDSPIWRLKDENEEHELKSHLFMNMPDTDKISFAEFVSVDEQGTYSMVREIQ